MNILICGASGMIGRALVKKLGDDHQISVLGRDKNHLKKHFPKIASTFEWDDLSCLKPDAFDVIIQLAGRNIAAARWSEQEKKAIIDSRVQTTRMLSDWILATNARPRVICANAIGIYGIEKDNQTFDEDSNIDLDNPKDFPAKVCTLWQQSLKDLQDAGVPVCITRLGPVLAPKDGMIGKLYWPFKLGLGSVIGSGHQIISWVHIEDVVNAFLFLINHHDINGIINITAPNPCEQHVFADELAKALHRPRLLWMPAFSVKLLFGEMGECLLLNGQHVYSKRLQEAGFTFKYPNIGMALKQIVQSS